MILAHPGSHGQTAIKQVLLVLLYSCGFICYFDSVDRGCWCCCIVVVLYVTLTVLVWWRESYLAYEKLSLVSKSSFVEAVKDQS